MHNYCGNSIFRTGQRKVNNAQDLRELQKSFPDAIVEVRGGNHHRLKLSTGRSVIVSATPGDRRAMRNVRATKTDPAASGHISTKPVGVAGESEAAMTATPGDALGRQVRRAALLTDPDEATDGQLLARFLDRRDLVRRGTHGADQRSGPRPPLAHAAHHQHRRRHQRDSSANDLAAAAGG